MQRFLRISLYVLLFVVMSSCDEGDLLPPASTQLIVEGWAEVGQSPHVHLTTSIALTKQYQSLDSLSNHIIRYATVSITDNGKRYYLTGKTRNKRYSFPFEYTTGQIVGLEGHTYTLYVDYEGFHSEATTTIPNMCHLDTIYPVEVSPSLYKIVAVPANEDNQNAIFFIQNNDTGGDYQYALQRKDEQGNVEILKALQQGSEGYDQYFKKGEDVFIRYSNMQTEGIAFWQSYAELLTLSRNFFLPYTENVASTIDGAQGYWLGYHSSYYHIKL